MASIGILFPYEAISSLARLRGPVWQELVRRILDLPEDDPDSLAFCWMMIDKCGCLRCTLHVYRLRGGCARCAKQAILSSKETDERLLKRFQQAKTEVLNELQHVSEGGE